MRPKEMRRAVFHTRSRNLTKGLHPTFEDTLEALPELEYEEQDSQSDKHLCGYAAELLCVLKPQEVEDGCEEGR